MPVITLSIGKIDSINEDVKKELIKGFTEIAVGATKIDAEKFTVFIEEYPLENIGHAGKSIKELIG